MSLLAATDPADTLMSSWTTGDYTVHGQYGVLQIPQFLALYDATGDPVWLGVVKGLLDGFRTNLEQILATQGWHDWFLLQPEIIAFAIVYLDERGLLSGTERVQFRDMYLSMARSIRVWGASELASGIGLGTEYRGPAYRAQGEAMLKRLAGYLYAGAPNFVEEQAFAAYADRAFSDWWTPRDNAINDTAYSISQLAIVSLGAWITGQDIWNDPVAKTRIWDRLRDLVSGEGILVPVGASGGWTGDLSTVLWLLELAATKTGDGTYRSAAHRAMNYLQYQQPQILSTAYPNSYDLRERTRRFVGLAYLAADDSIAPVASSAGSIVQERSRLVVPIDKHNAEPYLGPLDPDPSKERVDTDIIATGSSIPDKLILRSGTGVGELSAVVELNAAARPVNPGGILGIIAGGAALAIPESGRMLTMWQNLFHVSDEAGDAPWILNPNVHANLDRQPLDSATTVELEKRSLVDHATILVTRQMARVPGFPSYYSDEERYRSIAMDVSRTIEFVKNRFILVRDVASFAEAHAAIETSSRFRAREIVAQGTSWVDTTVQSPPYLTVPLLNPAGRLLVAHSPRPDRSLAISTVGNSSLPGGIAYTPFVIDYSREASIAPGQVEHALHLLFPHPASQDGASLASTIHFLVDTPSQAVVRIDDPDGTREWIVINDDETSLSAGGFASDARRAYVKERDGAILGLVVDDASWLWLPGGPVFVRQNRDSFDGLASACAQ